MKKASVIAALSSLLLVACGERSGNPEVRFEPAPTPQEAVAYEHGTPNSQNSLPPAEGSSPMAQTSDLGRTCQVPDGCDSDSPDFPGCLDAACEQDCALPIFAGLDAPGYCTRACRYDWECDGAVADGLYGTEFVCLSDGVSGVCAPGSNARCDGSANGTCARENESCKLQLIFAPDITYGAVCQPSTPDGVGVGEACDGESGVNCANDLCLFDGDNGFGTCMSFCDPNAEVSICPEGFRCFDDYYPFGTDFDNPLDMCLPEYCEKDADCPDSFYCGLTYEFNSERILRGFCLPRQEGGASNGDPCNAETNCEGATCFDADTDDGYCSGLCDDSSDCPEGFSCGIVNFGISADPGSAPAQLCMRGAGSQSSCRNNADCVEGEVCSYQTNGELEGGRPVTDIFVEGQCLKAEENAVNPGEACNANNPCAVKDYCLRAGVTFCGGTCATTEDCKTAYGLDDFVCFRYGLSETESGGLCVPGAGVQLAGSFNACRNNSMCGSAGGEVCTTNEECPSNECVIPEGGQACTTNEECASNDCVIPEGGQACTTNEECTSGECTIPMGEEAGTCAAPEAGACAAPEAGTCTAVEEYCAINVIGTFEPQAETICMADNGKDAGGAPCTSDETCQSGFCSIGEEGMGMCSEVCRETIDCVSGMVCEGVVVDEEVNAIVNLCVVSSNNVTP